MKGTEPGYTREELEKMIAQMQAVTGDFYSQASAIGNHGFSEMCGVMGEYIKMCRTTLHTSKDFTPGSVHSGVPRVAEPAQIEHLAEKLKSIFGPVLEDPKNRAIFCRGMEWLEPILLEPEPVSGEA